MARSPRWKVYREGEYVASCAYPEDAAMLVAGHDGAQIRDGHNSKRRVVWREGREGFCAGDSFDEVADIIIARTQEKPVDASEASQAVSPTPDAGGHSTALPGALAGNLKGEGGR